MQHEDVTQLLKRWSSGDQDAMERLMPIVYDELHRLAHNYLLKERQGHTLQPTALVHEAYLRIVDQKHSDWHDRAQFFGIAARLMRQILVDYARLKHAEKRGGPEQQRLSLTNADNISGKPDLDLLALHEAMEQLMALDPQQSRVVELRFFGGLSIEETAEVLGVGHATVEREWRIARAWLRSKLG